MAGAVIGLTLLAICVSRPADVHLTLWVGVAGAQFALMVALYALLALWGL